MWRGERNDETRVEYMCSEREKFKLEGNIKWSREQHGKSMAGKMKKEEPRSEE